MANPLRGFVGPQRWQGWIAPPSEDKLFDFNTEDPHDADVPWNIENIQNACDRINVYEPIFHRLYARLELTYEQSRQLNLEITRHLHLQRN